MTEREPIDDVAEELFAAARRERPEDRVRARAKQLALSARTGINAAEARQPIAYAPVIAVAVALAVLAVVAAGALRTREAPEPIVVTPEVVDPRAPARDETPAARRTAEPLEVIQDEPRMVEKPAQPQSKSAPRPQPSLAEEIALLDQARSALTAHESARVIALIDQYKKLGGTRMRAEAALLHIEALAQSGQRARAAQLAQRFVKEHAGNPLAERARTLAKIEDPSEDSR
jgi:hypothetical protein